MLAAADAIFDAERALREAADTVGELGEVAASSLRVLDDAATDAFYAHQEERKAYYLESAGEHLGRLRNRSGVMTELGEDLIRHLSTASGAIERAGYELGRGTGLDESHCEVRALRSQIDVLGEVMTLARPVADQITRHAQLAAESAAATDAPLLLDTRVHLAGQEVSRTDEDVSMMRSVIESARSRARVSAELAGSLTYPAAHSPVRRPDRPADPGVAF